LERDRATQLVRRRARDDCQRHFRADALDGEQQLEEIALGRLREAEQLQGVLAHMKVGLEHHLSPGLCLPPRAGRRVDEVADTAIRGRDQDGTSRLADGERGAGVDADEGLLEHDGVRRKLLYELLDAVEDRLEAQLWAAPRRRPPAVPLHRSEAASSFVDDSPSARSSAWID